jgi:hypothetical protein
MPVDPKRAVYRFKILVRRDLRELSSSSKSSITPKSAPS